MQAEHEPDQFELILPEPEPGESFERYAIRAHRALAAQVTDPEDRNMLVEECWRHRQGPTDVEQMAADRLDPDKYKRKANVCHFLEHETIGADGKPKKYDLAKIVKIIRNANDRIADLGAFPAISDGHTPPVGSNKPNPPILGYVGGYRLGQIGRKRPKWAVFADEYHDRAKAHRMRELPRRSVELWTFKDTGKSHFDPVAALGSEAPRLALPVAFQAYAHDGAEVDKYSFEAGAMAAPAPSGGAAVHPGGSNTHVKGFGTGPRAKRRKYQQAKQGATGMTLADQDLAQIVNAINSTPEFVWIRKKMQEDMADEQAAVTGDNLDLEAQEEEPEMFEEEPDLDEALAQVDDDDQADMAAMEQEDEVDEDLADIGDLLTEEEVDEVPEPDEEEEPERMSAKHETQAIVEKYNALSQSHAKLLQSHSRMQKQVVDLKRNGADARRREKLAEVASAYPGMVDLNEEYQACLYSAGATMTDEDFTKHVATIERYAARALPTGMVPGGVAEEENPEVEKYEAALAETAVELCTAAVNRGEVLGWDEGMAQAREQLKKG